MNHNELYHYGILGMKWGHHKQKNSFTQSKGYKKVLGKAMGNKTLNKAANGLTNYHVKNAKRKDEINSQTDKDLKYGMKKTGGSASDVRKGLDAANKAIAKKVADNNKPKPRDVRKANRLAVRNAKKEASRKLVKDNENRILKEIKEYDKKHGGDFAKKFLDNYDDLNMWDLYSPKELMDGL